MAPPKGARGPLARPTRNPSVDDSRLSAMQRCIDELYEGFLGRNGAHQDELKSTKGNAPVRRSDAKARVITSQPASVPGKHEVSFCQEVPLTTIKRVSRKSNW